MGKVIILTIAGFMFLSACTTGQQIKKLEIGMPKEQVIQLLGRPDGHFSYGEYEVLEYANRLMDVYGWDKADYYVVLLDDKVDHTAQAKLDIILRTRM